MSGRRPGSLIRSRSCWPSSPHATAVHPVIAINLRSGERTKVFPDPWLAEAVMDRLTPDRISPTPETRAGDSATDFNTENVKKLDPRPGAAPGVVVVEPRRPRHSRISVISGSAAREPSSSAAWRSSLSPLPRRRVLRGLLHRGTSGRARDAGNGSSRQLASLTLVGEDTVSRPGRTMCHQVDMLDPCHAGSRTHSSGYREQP